MLIVGVFYGRMHQGIENSCSVLFVSILFSFILFLASSSLRSARLHQKKSVSANCQLVLIGRLLGIILRLPFKTQLAFDAN